MSSTRRQFLKTAATASAVGMSASGLTFDSPVVAQDKLPKLRLASIGVGGSRGAYSRGGAIASQAAKFANMVAVCDVDDLHTEEFNQKYGGNLNKYRDYRELLEKEKPQVVTIGTPDHWHVPIAIAALRAGADVYCEKPLTLTIDEGKQIRAVVEETGRVFQVGTQQRSTADKFLTAIAMVHSGRLGKNVNAYVAIGGAPDGGPNESTAAPDDLDWNMWVGPAPEADYSEKRRKQFRWYFEYSGGKMTDWGAHHIDIAQWALAPGEDGPTRIKGEGQFTKNVPSDLDWAGFLDGDVELPDGFNTATKFHIDLKYDNGALINVNHEYVRESEEIKFGNGILFEGDKGRILVNRSKIQGSPINALTDADRAEIKSYITELCKGKSPGNHMGNFFECVGDRSKPISDVWSHHRTMTSCHLCNIALMTGRELNWDPKQEKFIGDEQANRFLSRKTRKFTPVG